MTEFSFAQSLRKVLESLILMNFTESFCEAMSSSEDVLLFLQEKRNNKEVDDELEILFNLLKAKKNIEAKVQLENVFKVLANIAESNW